MNLFGIIPGACGSSVILLRNQSPKTIRRPKIVAMSQHPHGTKQQKDHFLIKFD